MQYLITFVEGVISFVSPCMLPMLPVYLSYFAERADGQRRMLLRAACFVLGFTLVFSLLGVFAGGCALGVPGMLLALPAMMVARTCVRVFVQRDENI